MYQDQMPVWWPTCQVSQGSILKMPHMTVSLNFFMLMLTHDYMSKTTVILKLQETIWGTLHEMSNWLLTNLEVGSYYFTNFLQWNPVIAGKRKAILSVINNITAFSNHILIVEECWRLKSSLCISPESLVRHLLYNEMLRLIFLFDFRYFVWILISICMEMHCFLSLKQLFNAWYNDRSFIKIQSQ